MNVLILAPHQDDEILSSSLLIKEHLRSGNQVFVAFMTNGDRHGCETGVRRYLESREALRRLGIKENSIFYMGYGDTGMSLAHSFLYRLFTNSSEEIYHSFVGAETYHPSQKKTVHFMYTGQEAAYCRENFLSDLDYLMTICRPDVIVSPSPLDSHGDHHACALFLNELQSKRRISSVIVTYLIHAGDDLRWPNRGSTMFIRPPIVGKTLWKNRLARFYREEDQLEKCALIQLFQSQSPGECDNYLLSFAKQEEFFLPFDIGYPIINIFP